MPKSILISKEQDELALICFRGQHSETKRYLIREKSLPTLADEIHTDLRAYKKARKILLLKRDEIIRKRLVLPTGTGANEWPEGLETVLPFDLNTMSYGLAVSEASENETQAQFWGVPESKVRERMRWLETLGLGPDEVWAEDELICRGLQQQLRSEWFWVLDKSGARLLSVFCRDSEIHDSGVRSLTNAEITETELHELSMTQMDSIARTQKIMLSGSWSAAETAVVERLFQLPILRQEDATFETAYSRVRGKPMSSFLPKEDRLADENTRQKKKKQLLLLILLGLFCASIFYRNAEIRLVRLQADQLQKERQLLAPHYQKVNAMKTALLTESGARRSRSRLMELLVFLHEQLGADIQLTHFETESQKLKFSFHAGEHQAIASLMHTLESMPLISALKLEETRKRKGQGSPYYEFEVSGRWRP